MKRLFLLVAAGLTVVALAGAALVAAGGFSCA